ncbi:1-deoxy-D-xylulose-5-phosphate reductoisomerase [Clostridium sp. YIM B02505]|uniref:1-deoxy-D-xylulose 5-phosphate reductoisomerase n=1 Tax=Clostridium yunnanense TaxID=2800325 RepID=A0ABS1EMU1_9CLOT|nr:1-deoxy-D-xylulose-5-phosphate reductoisomerase [Clostridium yunnanense]MBK1810659.1 1-deoxy-D-xylulose-5-phosphate reductoisomerase [Clostridium yunnanense]
MKNIAILGATGSIGTQTLDVLRFHKDDFKLIGISANRSTQSIMNIIDEFLPKTVAMTDFEAYNIILDYCTKKGYDIEVNFGIEGLNKVATHREVDIVVTSVVGMIGLEPTLNAIWAGKTIALANKETLVVAGELVMSEARKNNVNILPVDSEHSAIFQSLQGNDMNRIDKILLTASGGPFRGKKVDDLKSVTVQDALKHPNWSMGPKITIDSATLMNKGLEVIEAHWLYNCSYDKIEVVIHPQSVIHSMVQYEDGAIIAQLGTPDMKLPIQYALNYPIRKSNIGGALDFKTLSTLTFETPDLQTFKCLDLAFKAGKLGKLMPCILNAANEACVSLFLDSRIEFLEIGDVVEECMNKFDHNKEVTLENVNATDKEVREYVFKKYE